jgi:hypothetical protein
MNSARSKWPLSPVRTVYCAVLCSHRACVRATNIAGGVRQGVCHDRGQPQAGAIDRRSVASEQRQRQRQPHPVTVTETETIDLEDASSLLPAPPLPLYPETGVSRYLLPRVPITLQGPLSGTAARTVAISLSNNFPPQQQQQPQEVTVHRISVAQTHRRRNVAHGTGTQHSCIGDSNRGTAACVFTNSPELTRIGS